MQTPSALLLGTIRALLESESSCARPASTKFPLEVGWLGGFTFITLLAVTVVRSLVLVYRGLRDPEFFVAIAALVGKLLNGFVIDASHGRHFWMLLGIVLGQLLVASYRQETQNATFQAARSGKGVILYADFIASNPLAASLVVTQPMAGVASTWAVPGQGIT